MCGGAPGRSRPRRRSWHGTLDKLSWLETAWLSVNASRKLNRGKNTFAILLLCATTAIALPAQTFTTLFSFNNTDGGDPATALVQGTDGNFYGTTEAGGANDYGTVFKITPSGALTTLYSFCAQSGCPDGEGPCRARG
jgi:uncharacterized repeat protein (TIGR03803 family)